MNRALTAQSPFALSHITIEMGLWALLSAGSLLLRVWALSAAPLNNMEASNALNALALTRGETVNLTNPLFTTLQAILIGILGANEFSARLPVALAGVLLCLTPVLLRGRIGRDRALLLGLLLTLSPTVWFSSRQADGGMVAWSLSFLAWCLWDSNHRRASIITTGILLATGLDAISPFLILAVLYVVNRIALSRQTRQRITPLRLQDLLLGAAAFIMASSSMLWRPGGIGDAFNGMAMWPQFLFSQGQASIIRLMTGWIIYEPLTILGAVVSVALLVLTRGFNMRAINWLVWTIAGLALFLLNGSRDATSLMPVVIGCAALTSATPSALLRLPSIFHLDEDTDYPRYAEVVVFGLTSVMIVYAYLGLMMYGAQHTNSWLVTLLLGMMMIAGIGTVATLTYGSVVALRGISLAASFCLLLYTISVGYQLTNTRAASPAEAYVIDAGADGLRDLDRTIQTLSTRAFGDPNSMPMQVLDTAQPALRWILRNQLDVLYVARVTNPPAALMPVDKKLDGGGSYIGSAFRITTSANLANIHCSQAGTSDQLDCTSLANWLTQRSIDERSITRWVLWLRSDTAQKTIGQ